MHGSSDRISRSSRLVLSRAALPLAVLCGVTPGCEIAQDRDSEEAAVLVTALKSLKEEWIADRAAIHGSEGIPAQAVDAARQALGIEPYDSSTVFCIHGSSNPPHCATMIVEIALLEIDDETARVRVSVLGPASAKGEMYGREGTVVLGRTRGTWRVLHIEDEVIV